MPALVAVAAAYAVSYAFTAAVPTLLGYAWLASVAGGVLGAVVAGGVSLLIGALTGQGGTRSLAGTSEDRKIAVRTPVGPWQVIYGQAQVAGQMVYSSSTGADQRFLHVVYVLAAHPCEAIDRFWVNDDVIELSQIDGAGIVRSGQYNNNIRLKWYLGNQTAADSDLVAESTDGWGAAHKLLGRTYVYARIEYNKDVWQTNFQGIRALVRGKNNIVDPRTGAASYTNNAALCVRDFLLWDPRLKLTTGDIDDSNWQAAANICDENVALDSAGTLTQKRYTVDYAGGLDQTPRQIMRKLLTGCAGAVTYVQGRYRMHPGSYSSPVDTLGPSDLAGPVRLTTRPARKDLFNAVKGTFISPGHNWQAHEFPALTSSTFEAEDGGVRLYREIELHVTIDVVRAQRLAKMELLRSRQALACEVPVKYEGIRWAVKDVLSVTVPTLGWSSKPMEVVGWRFKPDVSSGDTPVLLKLREISASAFAWTYDAAASLPATPSTNLISPTAIPSPTGLTVTASTAIAPDGTTVPALTATWTAAAHAFVRSTEIQWRVGAGAWNSAEVPYSSTQYVIQPVTVGGSYDVRVRAVAGLATSPWTTLISASGMADTTAPGPATGLTLSGITRGYTARWTNPTDADRDVAEVYELSGSTWVKVAESRADFATRTGLNPGDTAQVKVKIRDRSGNVGPDNTGGSASVTVPRLVTNDYEPGSIGQVTSAIVAGPWSPTSYTPVVSLVCGDPYYATTCRIDFTMFGTYFVPSGYLALLMQVTVDGAVLSNTLTFEGSKSQSAIINLSAGYHTVVGYVAISAAPGYGGSISSASLISTIIKR